MIFCDSSKWFLGAEFWLSETEIWSELSENDLWKYAV